MHFHVVTLFPEFFASMVATTMLKKGQERGALAFSFHDIRAYATDKHRVTDDTPYGGGQGMVMKPEPLTAAVEAAGAGGARPHRVLICGRYEGIDERVRACVDEELSIGDYVVSGGEIAAIVVIDAVARLVPGVLGCAASADDESFRDHLLEYPHYTRPPELGAARPAGASATERRRPGVSRHARPGVRALSDCRPFCIPSGSMADLFLALLHYPVRDKNGAIVTTAVTNMDIHDIARSACPRCARCGRCPSASSSTGRPATAARTI
jgi:tRNA (guanine37-N1)-methyltransferase